MNEPATAVPPIQQIARSAEPPEKDLAKASETTTGGPAGAILGLQRAYGNRHVQRVLGSVREAERAEGEVFADVHAEPAPAAAQASTEGTAKEAEPAASGFHYPPPRIRPTTIQLSNSKGVVLGGPKDNPVIKTPAEYTQEILVRSGVAGAENWFNEWATTTFLGVEVGKCHMDMVQHLAQIEEKFLADPELNPTGKASKAEVGRRLGLKEGIIGGRVSPTAAKISMHLFGLAIDVNYTTNPYLGANPKELPPINEILARAAAAVGRDLGGPFKPEYPTRPPNEKDYQRIQTLDEILESYFALLDAPEDKLKKEARSQIEADLRALATVDLDGGKTRSGLLKRYPKVLTTTGIFDLSRKLVFGLELNWGGTYGDIQHFDMRNKGRGAQIYQAIQDYREEIKKR